MANIGEPLRRYTNVPDEEPMHVPERWPDGVPAEPATAPATAPATPAPAGPAKVPVPA